MKHARIQTKFLLLPQCMLPLIRCSSTQRPVRGSVSSHLTDPMFPILLPVSTSFRFSFWFTHTHSLFPHFNLFLTQFACMHTAFLILDAFIQQEASHLNETYLRLHWLLKAKLSLIDWVADKRTPRWSRLCKKVKNKASKIFLGSRNAADPSLAFTLLCVNAHTVACSFDPGSNALHKYLMRLQTRPTLPLTTPYRNEAERLQCQQDSGW